MSEKFAKELSLGQGLELGIEKLVERGKGLARLADGRVVFVEGGLAGEKVRARLTGLKKSYAEARVTEVLEASPRRVAPACPHYGLCGGCDLMHLAHPAQLEAKAGWLSDALRDLTPAGGCQVRPSPAVWGYRNRVRWQVRNGGLGFFQRASHRLLPPTHCPVAHPAIERLMGRVGAGLKAMPGPGPSQIEALAGADGRVFLTAFFGEKARPDRAGRQAWKRAAQAWGAHGLRLSLGRSLEPWPLGPDSTAPLPGPEGLDLRAAPGLFCQVNFGLNAELLALVRAAAGRGRGQSALDLYAGWGNLGLALAANGWQVTGVESAPGCPEAASFLAGLNGLEDRLDLLRGDARQYLRGAVQGGKRFELIVLDPPRSGAKGLMPWLASLQAGRVVYVSCHLAALVRDARELVKLGYSPQALWLLDMFPHTCQVESLLVLDRG